MPYLTENHSFAGFEVGTTSKLTKTNVVWKRCQNEKVAHILAHIGPDRESSEHQNVNRMKHSLILARPQANTTVIQIRATIEGRRIKMGTGVSIDPRSILPREFPVGVAFAVLGNRVVQFFGRFVEVVHLFLNFRVLSRFFQRAFECRADKHFEESKRA